MSADPTSPTHNLKSETLEGQVSTLQVLLENKNLVDTESFLQMLDQCFFMCTVESLDEQVFQKILPGAHRSLLQVIKAINEKTSNNKNISDLDYVKRKLRFCDDLLIFWRKCLEHVSALNKVQAVYVASLCNTLPETTRIMLEHCKASPETYGTLLSGAMQELKNLFSRAVAVFKLFFATLDGVIVFDTDVESETELLTKVVDAYGGIASIANGMDTKAYIEISEAFAKLAVDYEAYIKHASPNSVTIHLTQIAKDASCRLSLLFTMKDQNDKNVDRSIAATMRLLSIVKKLTSIYGTFLTYEMLLCLVELLTTVHGYSYIDQTKYHRKTIPVDVMFFVNIIFNHDKFKEAYFEYGKKLDVCRLNYHLLTITIMKKLNCIPYKHNCKWSVGADSILDVAFTHIEDIQKEAIVGELRLPANLEIGERPRLAGIYEATLVPICDLISQFPPEAFHVLELLLLKHLLSGRFWTSLLSSDVWCFVGRLSSSQLCADHVRYLIRVSGSLAESRDTVEAIMLENMIGRLYELLSEDAKSALLKDLTDLNAKCNTPTLYWLAAKTKGSRLRHSINKYNDLSKAFLDLQKQPTAQNWEHLMQHISALQTVDYSDNKDINDVLVKIWNFVADVATKCGGKQLDLLSDFVIVLLNSTHPGNLRDDVLDSVLGSIASFCACMPARVKIKFCQYLRQNVENLDRCRSQGVSALIKLFSRQLQDESAWVCQEALESFEHIGHMCSEQLVGNIAKGLAKIPTISNIMQTYLSCTSYYVLEDFSNVYDYLEYVSKIATQTRAKRTCYEHEVSEREKKLPILERKDNSQDITPTMIQLDEQAEEMYKGLTETLEGRANISETVCRKLITVLEKILSSSKK